MWKICLGLIQILVVAAPARAQMIYVDDGAPAGGDGSMARPFQSLQAAVDAAAGGEEIRVASGTYAPFMVSGKELRLRGRYSADFSMRVADAPSVVQGMASGPVVTLFEVGASVLEGFLILGGQRGIVIDADFASTTNRPEIRDNVIEGNGSETMIGGGVFADHCDATFTGNTIGRNIALRGAGMATLCRTLLVEDNLIEQNIGYEDHGGGLYLSGGTMTIRGNVIRGNRIGEVIGYGWGGGAIVYGEGSMATFERNVFTGNHAEGVGGGAFIDDGAMALFDHDLFWANECSAGGAALYVDGYGTDVSSRVRLVNVTIAFHPCPDGLGNAVYVEGQSTVDFVNSIVWGNGGDDFAVVDGASTITGTYTLSEEPLDGPGNLSADPLFAEPGAGDFHVRSTRGRYDPATGTFVMDAADSPTIDVGDPAAPWDMEPGPNGMRINLGHTGNTPEASMGGPGGTPPDAGPPPDGGNDAGPSGRDAGGGSDAGPPSGGGDGCGCRATGRSAGAGAALVLLMALLLLRPRSERARRAGRGRSRRGPRGRGAARAAAPPPPGSAPAPLAPDARPRCGRSPTPPGTAGARRGRRPPRQPGRSGSRTGRRPR